MQNSPRMIDFERCVRYSETQPPWLMSLAGGEEFNSRLFSILPLIDGSYDHSAYDIREPAKYRFESKVFSSTIDFGYIPNNFIQNKYVSSYIQTTLIERMAMVHRNKEEVYKYYEDANGSPPTDNQIYSNLIDWVLLDVKHLYHLWRFGREMQNMYVLNEASIKDLYAMDFNCCTHDLKSPNRSIYILFPPSPGGFQGMYVELEETYTNDKALRIYSPAIKPKRFSGDPMDTGAIYWELILKSGTSIKRSLNEAIHNSSENGTMASHVVEQGGDVIEINSEKEFMEKMTGFSHLAVQTLLFINGIDKSRSIIVPPKKEIPKKRIKKFVSRERTQRDYHDLGSNKIYINGKKYEFSGNGNSNGRKITMPFFVKEHDHSYWYKNPMKIQAIHPDDILEIKYDDMGERMVRATKRLKQYQKGEGEPIEKEYHIRSSGWKSR